jgi:transcriptional regulator with XRE-family HTH domain
MTVHRWGMTNDDKDRSAQTLAMRLRDLREKRGLTQDEVAAYLGLGARAQVSYLESGKRRLLFLEGVALARLYRVPLSRLTEGL